MRAAQLTAAFLLATIAPVVAPAAWADEAPAAPTVSMEEATTLQAVDHVIGAEDAPDTMVIYASVTCGHCGSWFTEQWPEVKAELVDTGKLRVAFREFPTAPAQVSIAGFMIAGCGAEENYWNNVVTQMQGQDAMRAAFAAGKGEEAFAGIAAMSGLDTPEQMQACFTDDDVFAGIERNMQRAEAAGLSGVPAFFVNGEKLDGAHQAADIIAAVAAE